MKKLVEYFIDGTEVNFDEMLSLGLIQANGNGYSLTNYGRSFLCLT